MVIDALCKIKADKSLLIIKPIIMKTFGLFLIVLSFLIPGTVLGQVKLSSYSIYALGVSVPVTKNIGTELKVFANTGDLEYICVELSGMYKFQERKYHQFSSGLGLGLTPFSEDKAFVSIPFALEIWPLQSFKRLSCVIELAPEIYTEGGTNLRHLWGIRYAFGDRE